MDLEINNFLIENFSTEASQSLFQLNGGGSSRKYYRFWFNNQSYLLTKSANVEENLAFINFTNSLKKITGNIPEIYQINSSKTIYIQQDLGNTTLMDLINENPTESNKYFKPILNQLIDVQIRGLEVIDFNSVYSYPKLNNILILRDLFQFKFYFLNVLNVDYNVGKLVVDFEKFALNFNNLQPQGFVLRDFQSRNIMIFQDQPYFIDYQGGLLGPVYYDLVSLIWQAKANLSKEFKEELYAYYTKIIKEKVKNLDEVSCLKSYQYCVVARLLQVLGAYGLRGLIERKKHFLESILYGINNLKEINTFKLLDNYPEMQRIINLLIEEDTLNLIEKRINE